MTKSILLLTTVYPALGGVAKVSGLLADYWQRHGYRVSVLALKAEDQVPMVDDLQVDYLPDCHDYNSQENLDYIEQYVRRHAIDIVINQGVLSKSYLRFQGDASHHFVNVLHACPDWLFVVPRTESLSHAWRRGSVKAVLRGLLHRLPWVSKHLIKHRLRQAIEASSAYVVLSEAYKLQIEQLLYRGRPQAKLKVIPNVAAPMDASHASQKRLMYAGRFSRADKQLPRLLRAWSRLEALEPDWTLHLVGEGPDLEPLRSLVDQLRLQRVVFDPPCWDRSLYAEAAIFCLPSSYEGMNLALLEAQSAGVVPIAFDINGGMRDTILHGQTGLLVPPFDEQAYADAMQQLMHNDAQRDQMAEAARQHAAKFAIDRVGAKWISLFKQLSP